MIRTQISLTEEQMERLRAVARSRGVSIAAVVRAAIDRYLAFDEREAARRRALGALGVFSSGPSNTSEEHDAALEDAYLA